jgi:hypothetical protein
MEEMQWHIFKNLIKSRFNSIATYIGLMTALVRPVLKIFISMFLKAGLRYRLHLD